MQTLALMETDAVMVTEPYSQVSYRLQHAKQTYKLLRTTSIFPRFKLGNKTET